MAMIKEVHVNGSRREINADENRTLLSVLRDDLDLTGSKYGCGEGQCGACTVLIDGKPSRSCITAISEVGAKQIRTIEGLANGEQLHPVQSAFLECEALQCAYCTSGMIMSAVGLLEKKPQPARDEILQAMHGNICRCGTHHRVVAAIEQAALSMKGGA